MLKGTHWSITNFNFFLYKMCSYKKCTNINKKIKLQAPLQAVLLGFGCMYIVLSGTCVTAYNFERWETNLIFWDLERDVIAHVRNISISATPISGNLHKHPPTSLCLLSLKSSSLNNCSQMPHTTVE